MTRWIILSAALISLPFLTDVIVDSQFRYQDTGYSHEEADSVDQLIDRANGEGTAKRRHKILSGSDDQAVLQLLWGEGE